MSGFGKPTEHEPHRFGAPRVSHATQRQSQRALTRPDTMTKAPLMAFACGLEVCRTMVRAMNTKTLASVLTLALTLSLGACGADTPSGSADAASGAPDAGAPLRPIRRHPATSPLCREDSSASAAPDVVEESCPYTGTYLLAGPCEAGHDAELAQKARRYERTWVTFHTALHGANRTSGSRSITPRSRAHPSLHR